ncbi:Cytidylate kinase [Diplonema papillatum]|nr:Cytidylate kinase [Diplonema papillatum]
MGKRPIVAIDGPVGAGKSSVSKEVSRRLGFGFVDTGACYRCVALASIRDSVGPENDEALKGIVGKVNISFEMTPDGINHVYLDGSEVTTDIRKEEVSMRASKTSKNQVVRDGLMGLQRRLGEVGGVVLEGRDIGTVVFPQAEVKIFLTADEKVRAKRRFDELVGKGETPDFEQVLKDLKERDHADMTRAVAPLKEADDAVRVDTSTMSFDESVDKIVKLVETRSGK